MRTIETSFETFGASVLLLGYKKDNLASKIVIDCADALEEYQGATATLSIVDPEGTVYPGDVTIEAGVVTWLVKARDTAYPGHGSARLDLVDNEGTVVASCEGVTLILNTHMSGVAPDAIEDWVDEASDALTEVRALLLDLNEDIEDVAVAEAARVLAEQGRVSAEELRVIAENARVSAETGRVTAESGRVTAEQGRATAEQGRVTAEQGRVTAEISRSSAERLRNQEENTRRSNEQSRNENEYSRMDAETTRNGNEVTRISAETDRVSAESDRVSAEHARVENEVIRVTNEGSRNASEFARANAEVGRSNAESVRASHELDREAAEEAREEGYSTIEQNAQAALSYIGPSEASSTASAAHAQGSYLIYDGKLYQVTADIAIGATLATTGTGANIAQVTGGVTGEVADLKSAFANYGGSKGRLLDEVTELTGNMMFNPEDWYNGNVVYDTSSGWTYSDNVNSVLTKPGVTFSLQVGDVVSLTNYSGHRFRVSWRANNVYSMTDWKSANYKIIQNGEYIIQLANNPTAIADVYTLLSLLRITKVNSSIGTLQNQINTNAANIENDDNKIATLNAFSKSFFDFPQNYKNIPILLYANANIQRIDVADGETIIASTKHVLTEHISVSANRDIIISFPTGYAINLLCYDSNYNYLGRFGGQQYTSSTVFSLYNETRYQTTAYIRVLINKTDNSDATIEMANDICLFNGTASQNMESVHLKVMTFNVGRYAWGTDPFYLTEEQYQQYIGNYKTFFGEQKPDILCLQENGQYFDADHLHSTGSELYAPLFPFNIDYAYTTAIKSKWKFESTKNEDLSNGRWFSTAILNINGKRIFIGSTHLSVNDPTKRAQEFADIVALTANYDYCIIGMDSNVQSFSEITALTDNGFKAANGGYFGWKYTYCSDPTDYSKPTPTGEILYLDNIFTKGNIIIDDIKVINEYTKLTSDHLPFVAYLTIY